MNEPDVNGRPLERYLFGGPQPRLNRKIEIGPEPERKMFFQNGPLVKGEGMDALFLDLGQLEPGKRVCQVDPFLLLYGVPDE